jgi:multicomponent Na+:H+ antiporter subunit B
MNPSLRQVLFWLSAVAVFAVTTRALVRLPALGQYRGPYGDVINQVVLPERHTPQSVAAVTFDYRGFDTLGEEHILLAAVAGVVLLLRAQRSERQEPARDEASDRQIPPTDDLLRSLGTILFGGTLLFGAYIVLHGHLTPGGGFQGGVLLASAFFYIYLSGEYEAFHKVTHAAVFELIETIGAGGFVLVGLAGLLAGAAFLQNILPLGQPKALFSAGTLLLLNVLVGLEVFGGLILTLSEFFHQTLELRGTQA